MRALSRLVAALALVLSCTLVSAPAHAEDKTPSSWKITEYVLNARPDKDGNVQVGLDIAFDFGREAGHGPFIVLPRRMGVNGDPDHWRELPVTVGPVTSSTGANTTVKRETKMDQLVLRIGRKGVTHTGVQRYHIDYTVRGLISLDNPVSHLDEVNWNAVGPAWQVPIQRATVVIQGPAATQQVGCFTGRGFRQPCEARVEGDRAVYSAGPLAKEVGVQTVAGYPVGTFSAAAAPTFSKRYHAGNMFPATPATLGVAGLVTAAGFALLFLRVRRSGRDKAYAGLTPGLAPMAGTNGQAVRASGRQPVAVQFSPPRDARPGEIGTLIDEKADPRDVTATIVDLAVRGHLKIEQRGPKDFVLHKRLCPEQIPAYERAILDKLFIGRELVTRDDLKTGEFATLMSGTQTALYDRVTTERGWFTKNPKKVRASAMALGVLVVMLGLGSSIVLGVAAGLGYAGLGVAVVGVALMVASGRMPARTPDGSAVLAQAKGFQQYLATAEAGQIRFEEGVDIFSRYLPYAIVFGVADRWAKVFKQLADQGMYRADTRWYDSPGSVGFFYGAGMGSAFDGMTSSMSAALQSSVQAAASSSSSSSSSSSGFSGGGGFGGGGGGGW